MHQVDENENVSLQPLQPLNFELKITTKLKVILAEGEKFTSYEAANVNNKVNSTQQSNND